jgi:putative phage-type endonuclease
MTTFTTEDRLAFEPIPFAGMVDLNTAIILNSDTRLIEQGTDEWKKARLGHVSGSSIADVMAKGRGVTRKNYLIKMVAERLTGMWEESYKNSAMDWGTQTEPLARIAYENHYQSFVDKTGFWKHPTIQYLGVSPDGLVGSKGLIEIKCPNTTTHLDYIFDDKVPATYYKQMQCQLWVTGREWCDFVSFDPRLPIKNQLFVKRCVRDEELIAEMEVEVKQFLSEVEVFINILSGEK